MELAITRNLQHEIKFRRAKGHCRLDTQARSERAPATRCGLLQRVKDENHSSHQILFGLVRLGSHPDDNSRGAAKLTEHSRRRANLISDACRRFLLNCRTPVVFDIAYFEEDAPVGCVELNIVDLSTLELVHFNFGLGSAGSWAWGN